MLNGVMLVNQIGIGDNDQFVARSYWACSFNGRPK